MSMLAYLVALSALAGATHADCEACIDSVCHSRTTIISGLPITDQMAIDRTDNILYLQINGSMNAAFFLDHPELRVISMMRTTGMVVDQKSRQLYLGTKEIPRTFYAYDPASNTMKTYFYTGEYSDLQDCSGNNLLLVMGASDWRYTYLKSYTISGLVVDKYYDKVYFVSNNTLYVHYDKDQPPRAIWRRDDMVISPNELPNGMIEVYIGDASEKVIYKLDKTTEELNVYAAYKTGAVAEFVFGKNNQILFRDVDGSVLTWVPSPEHEDLYGISDSERRCAVDPPSANFSIRLL